MKVFLVRHTTPDISKDICYGQSDLKLVPEFKIEIKKVHTLLKNTHYAKVYSSPLIRCKTLALSLVKKDNEIIQDDRLMEFNFGDWELKTWKEIEKIPVAKEWFDDYIQTPVPGGESFTQLIDRVQDFIGDLKENLHDNVLIVTHLGVIRAFSVIINRIDAKAAFDLKVGYGEMCELELRF